VARTVRPAVTREAAAAGQSRVRVSKAAVRSSAQRRSARAPVREAALPEHVARIQRSRLLASAASAIEEQGYVRTTVADITSRARVSRRTFYELFDNRDACLEALIEDIIGLIREEIREAGLDGRSWLERVRGGLTVILRFFDREPTLARLCIVHALRGGPEVLERREAILMQLAEILDEGRGQSARAAQATSLTAEALVGALFGIVHARLQRREREPLIALLGELMALIALPYLGPAAARREQGRARERTAPSSVVDSISSGLGRDPLADLPMRVTYRTARVLECIAEQPGISNRGVADRAGISDQGQVSKLLARLQRLGLVHNQGEGHVKGEPNAWQLTPLGGEVTRRLRSHRPREVTEA
jgi:AcrR family transcriptional regulator/DNA-binding MarR family transcriptional regulator